MMRLTSALLMTATLAAPIAVPTSAFAGKAHANVTISVRVFDPFRRDYHYWDRHEEREYRTYLAARHRSYREYRRQGRSERLAYWRWRHEREERHEHER